MLENLDQNTILIAAGGLVLAVLAGIGLSALFLRKPRTDDGMVTALADLARANAELQGRLSQIANDQQAGRAELQKSMNERLDAVTKRVGDSLGEQTQRTAQSLQTLNERLALIDAAQKNISELSGEVTGLKQILSNNQARGAFGEMQIEEIISDILPANAFKFQTALSNGSIPDALVSMPKAPGPVPVDSKFTLPSYRNYIDSNDPDSKKTAARAFKADIKKHINDISDKYLIAGETADLALMFVPSEAVYATIHVDFADLIDFARKKRVFLVSPTTLMAMLTAIRAVMRDAEMHKQAAEIQKVVGLMLDDVKLLDKRVGNLRTRFVQANEDINDIETSTRRITSRGQRVREVEFDETDLKSIEPPN
ncbi:DNA recombination protein RmuC [Hyphobacterium sp.]|uniref:DNA recombination protein RmuC n=1 Tax=Hyphobacterium sp. TaxID=2004662 RepID=UPI003BAA8A2A